MSAAAHGGSSPAGRGDPGAEAPWLAPSPAESLLSDDDNDSGSGGLSRTASSEEDSDEGSEAAPGPGAAAVAAAAAAETQVAAPLPEPTANPARAPRLLERVIRRGSFVGHPNASDCSGTAEVVLRGDELWLRVARLRCAAASSGTELFLYTSPRPRPIAVADLEQEGPRVPLPGTGSSGVEEVMPRLMLVPTAEIRRGPPATDPGVHWRDMASVFICRPGQRLLLQGGDVPTAVFGYCTLQQVSVREAAAARGVVPAPSGTVAGEPKASPEETKASGMPAAAGSKLVGKSWAELGELARATFRHASKSWRRGTLDFREFKAALRDLGVQMTEARAWLWFQTADASGNGALECSELQTAFRILQLLASPARHLPWDSYFAFDSDPKDHTTRFRPGKVDVVAFHGICRAYGLRVSLAKAEAVFQKLDPAGKLRVPYRKFFDGFATLLDPRFELTRRGINPRQLPAGLPRNPREAARVVISEEEARLVVQVQQAAAAAAADRKAERQEHELLSKGAWVRRQMEYRKAKRAAALRERAGQRAKEREQQSSHQIRSAELQLRRLVAEKRGALRRAAALDQAEDVRGRVEAKAALVASNGLGRVLLSGRGLTHLPPGLWVDPDAAALLPSVLLLDASRNALRTLPGLKLFAQLEALRKLDVSSNCLTSLPAAISWCARLQILNASANVLEGVPAELGSLGELVSLDLSSNRLRALPAELATLSLLRSLRLDGNELRSLPDGLGEQCGALARLSLHSNLLGSLPESLASCTALTELDVSWNKLRRLPPGMGSLERLRRLVASHNELVELPPLLGSCSSLEALWVEHNGLTRLPDSICRMGRLASLRASHNRLSRLPADLGDCQSLLELTARHNLLEGLPGSLGRMADLQMADLAHNRISAIPGTIGGCRSLRHLSLAHNRVGQAGGDPLPPSFPSLASLEVLDLSRNRIERLGPVIGMHSSLAQLVLEGNLLSELPDELGQTASLVELCVAGNMLTQLQDAVCARLGSLRTLDASNNRLRSVSPALGRITTLRHLNLFHNLLETLPLELAPAMTRLESFDVGRNPLSELPRKLAGVRPLGVRALATSLQSPWLQVGYLAQANARAREARAVRQVEDANEAADAVEAQRAGMLLEDGRAKEWELAGVNLELRSWRAPGDAPVAWSKASLAKPATGHSLADWFSQPRSSRAQAPEQRRMAAEGDVPSLGTGLRPKAASLATAFAAGSPATAQADELGAATLGDADASRLPSAPSRRSPVPLLPLRGTGGPEAGRGGGEAGWLTSRPATADAVLQVAPKGIRGTLGLLRRHPGQVAEQRAVCRVLRGPPAVAGQTADAQQRHAESASLQLDTQPVRPLLAPAAGPRLFRFGKGLVYDAHRTSPSRPMPPHEEAAWRLQRARTGATRHFEIEDSARAAPQTASWGESQDEAFEARRSRLLETHPGSGQLGGADLADEHESQSTGAAPNTGGQGGPLATPRAEADSALAEAASREASHEPPVDLMKRHVASAVFSRGYTTADVGEHLMVQERFHSHATAEWLENGSQYLQGTRKAADFRSAVRRRCGLGYSAALQPAIDAFFQHATTTSMVPLLGSYSPGELAALRELRAAGSRTIATGRDAVARDARARASLAPARYQVDLATLGQRVMKQERESSSRLQLARAEEVAAVRRRAARARVRIEANSIALYRLQREAAMTETRALQREVARRTRIRDQQAAARELERLLPS